MSDRRRGGRGGRRPQSRDLPAGLSAVFASRAPAGPTAPPPPPSIPEALAMQWRGRPLASWHRGLGPAVHLLGGPDVLLYLFARVSSRL